jgi:hypothetical protein
MASVERFIPLRESEIVKLQPKVKPLKAFPMFFIKDGAIVRTCYGLSVELLEVIL